MDYVKAEAPPLCKDILTQTTAKQNIFSENSTAVATKLSAYNYFCLGSPDRFEIAIYEMGLCTQNPISGTPKAFSKANCEESTLSSKIQAEGALYKGAWVLSARRTYIDKFVSLYYNLTNETEPFKYYFWDIHFKGLINLNQNNHYIFFC